MDKREFMIRKIFAKCFDNCAIVQEDVPMIFRCPFELTYNINGEGEPEELITEPVYGILFGETASDWQFVTDCGKVWPDNISYDDLCVAFAEVSNLFWDH